MNFFIFSAFPGTGFANDGREYPIALPEYGLPGMKKAVRVNLVKRMVLERTPRYAEDTCQT
ncbi:MAG: hypothetical protein QNJ02_12990 [Desulfobacterales bacterium]|nr:hypothetical protein [Desulfobacterales bacterium]MDJ0876184.1 hypothetical protein [Desulfobacterales bacterium]